MGLVSVCLKYVLHTINTIFALLGLLLVVQATLSVDQLPTGFIIYLYAVGVILFISSLIGCCGICQENVCLTSTYAFILLVALILQLVSTFGMNFNAKDIESFAAEGIELKWNNELVEPGAMDATQTLFHCCGLNGPDDYIAIGRNNLPFSCYPDIAYAALRASEYPVGCLKASTKVFLNIYYYIRLTAWCSLILTFLICCTAFYLVHRFRKKPITYNH